MSLSQFAQRCLLKLEVLELACPMRLHAAAWSLGAMEPFAFCHVALKLLTRLPERLHDF